MSTLTRKTIAIPLMLGFISVAMVMMMAGYYININELHSALDEREEAKMLGVMNFIRSRINDMHNTLRLTSEALSHNPELKDFFRFPGRRAGSGMQRSLEMLHHKLECDLLMLVGRDGRVIETFGHVRDIARGEDLSGVWGVSDALDGRTIETLSRINQRWFALSIASVSDGQGVAGVAVSGYRIADSLASRLSMETGVEVAIATDGHVIASSVDGDSVARYDFNIIRNSIKQDMTDVIVHGSLEDPYYLYSAMSIIDETFCVVLRSTAHEVVDLLTRKKRELVSYSLAAFVFLMFLNPLFFHYLIIPLNDLRKRTYSIARKYSGHEEAEVGGSNEIDSLSRSFDVLAAALDERMEMERGVRERLEKSNQALRRLSAHISNVREEEQRRISRRVHDELGQRLLALKMLVGYIRKNTPEKSAEVERRLSDVLAELDHTVGIVQNITAELRPAIIDDLGLDAALDWHAEQTLKKAGISYTLQSVTGGAWINPALSLAFFRVFREATANIIEHSGANEVRIDISVKDNTLTLEIRDNGRGVEASSLMDPSSYGIMGMVERMEQVGGSLDVESPPEGGTLLRASAYLG